MMQLSNTFCVDVDNEAADDETTEVVSGVVILPAWVITETVVTDEVVDSLTEETEKPNVRELKESFENRGV